MRDAGRTGLLLAAAIVAGCAHASRPPASPEGPYVLVLGTAQDGGLPQTGCDEPPCRAAREDPARRRLVASLLVVDPASGRRWLIDATPDIGAQVERARGHPAERAERPGRPPLFDGIFLSHAHVGHYAGLLHFGREAYGAEAQETWASARMRRFLETNGPWDLLVRAGHVALRDLRPDEPIDLGGGLSITPILVPHRDEYSDTFGFVIRGPRRAVLYVPDIDKWERWERRIEDVLGTVDVALLDGTFHDGGELPGRAMAEIPHPFIVESLRRFASLPASVRARVRFTHLNHSNPAADPAGAAAAAIRGAGCSVAAEGMIFGL